MQRMSTNLTNDCDEKQLNYNNDLSVIGNKIYAVQKVFGTDFFVNNFQRETPTVIHHLLSSPRQPTTLWPKAPNFAFLQIFLCKIIWKNNFIVKFIKMYSLIFT